MRKVLIIAASGFAAAAITLATLVYAIKTPDLDSFKQRRVAESTKIYDRTGEILLYDIHGEERRTVIPFAEIPRYVKNATIALEDDNFYKHLGFRPIAFLRAIVVNLVRGSFEQGGSTITQQIVKSTLLTPEKTVLRKIHEIVIALKLERRYSKDEILGFYLNQIPYGSNAYGIEAASETFFGKHARDLALLETAYLVSLPNAPSYYSPYGKHRKELDSRAEFALRKMRDLGFISSQEYGAAQKQKIVFSQARAQGIIAPHFVIEVREKLNKMFGDDVVETGGLKVITTLDVDLQQKSEEVIRKYAPTIKENFDAGNAAVTAIDPKTGGVLAMVGSKDYFDIAHEGNFNVATALRQPGSAFKPFVYATAIKNGFTPETVVFDLPTEFNPSCTVDGKPKWILETDSNYVEALKKCYHPINFDEKFRGPVTFREALAQSLNVPSVKVLYLAGLENSLLTARDFGITSLNDPERYGLTMVLGGGEVSLLELTSAFSVFANEGLKNNYKYILKIDGADGKNLYSDENRPQEAIDRNIARTISDILSDNNARAPAFGEFSAIYFPGKKVAAKTGTTNDFRDAWVIGYTPDIALGAWSGNNDNAPMKKKVAGFIVAPWWHEIMDYILTKNSINNLTPPSPFSEESPWLRGEWRGGKEFVVDKASGKLATDLTPEESKEKKVIREIHSILYWLGRTNDAQFKNWEEPIRAWAIKNGYFDQDANVIPTTYDDVHLPENFPKIKLKHITPTKTSYSQEENILLKLDIESKYALSQIDYFDGGEEKYLGSAKKYPWEFGINLGEIDQNKNGDAEIKIRIYDVYGNKTEDSISVPIKYLNI